MWKGCHRYQTCLVLFFLLTVSPGHAGEVAGNASEPRTIAHAILEKEAEVFSRPPTCALLETILAEAQQQLVGRVASSPTEAFVILQQIAAIFQQQHVQVGDAMLLSDTCQPTTTDANTIYRADCDTLSFLYLAIGDILNFPLRMVSLPDHTFIRWYFPDGSYLNWETTANAVWTEQQYFDWYNTTHADPLAPEQEMRTLQPAEIWGIVHYNIGNALTIQRRYAEAITQYTLSLDTLPAYVNASYQRGNAWYALGDFPQAVVDFTQVLQAHPGDIQALQNRGSAWNSVGEYSQAIADFTRVLALQPENVDALYNRGMAWYLHNNDEQALADFQCGLELHPQDAELLAWRGLVWNRQGQYAQASADFTRAVEINPWSAEVNNTFAWFLATCPEEAYRNGSQAVSYAQRALVLNPGLRMVYFDTLAAAYAEIGQFEQAIAMQTNALRLIETTGLPEDVNAYRRRLELYQAHQPYRENVLLQDKLKKTSR